MRALSLLLVGLLAACTSGSPTVPAGDGPTGGTLRVAISAPATVDPGNAYEPASDLVLRTLCDPLIGTDPTTGALRPALAESWVVTDRGARLVLRLRKGIRFSDGSPVKADDVVFAFTRVASADYASAAADRLDAVLGYAQLHGDEPARSDRELRRLAGVRALDTRSVEISLSRPQADFLRLLTSPLVTPVPRRLAERDPAGFARRPVCSGPYRLAAPYQHGDRVIRLERVRRGGPPYADGVEFLVSADPAAAVRRGTADVAYAGPSDHATSTTRLASVPGPDVEYVAFPTSTPPYDAPAVRRALSLALDREALVRRVFPGTRVPATGFLPPTTLPVFRTEACRLPPHGDVAAARATLVAAGIDLTGVRTVLSFNDEFRNAALAREVAAQWRSALGLVATPSALPPADFLARGRRSGGFTGPSRFGWSTPYADPDGMLFPLFASDRIGRDNVSRFSDPAVDRLLVRQAREATQPEDRALDQQHAEQLLCAAMPMAPLTFSLRRVLISTKWRAAGRSELDRTTGQPLLRGLALTP